MTWTLEPEGKGGPWTPKYDRYPSYRKLLAISLEPYGEGGELDEGLIAGVSIAIDDA